MSLAEAEISCAGKEGFATYSEAQAAVRRTTMRRRRRGSRRDRLEIYRCTACRRWHVGSSIFKSRRSRPRDFELEDIEVRD